MRKWSIGAGIFWEGSIGRRIRARSTGNIGDAITACQNRQKEGMGETNWGA